MHPCLYVDEIVRLIAHELVASRRKATAVALACCCKNFEDPVLDALWEALDMLLPLLKTLPGDVWNPGGYKVSASTIFVLDLLNNYPKDFQKIPNETGMGSLPKVRSKGARVQPVFRSGRSIPGSFFGSAVLSLRQTLVPKSENPLLVDRYRGVHPIYSHAPFP